MELFLLFKVLFFWLLLIILLIIEFVILLFFFNFNILNIFWDNFVEILKILFFFVKILKKLIGNGILVWLIILIKLFSRDVFVIICEIWLGIIFWVILVVVIVFFKFSVLIIFNLFIILLNIL